MDKDPSEIVKLTERISKDPKSKLFVPLAEEYKKIGDLEMAIHVLSEGLKNNPTYVTARSLLGRLLFDRGDLNAAQREFEEVIRAIPDNLIAQKKLGDLLAIQNKKAEALVHYKVVLALNPGDAAIASIISTLEAAEANRRQQNEPPSSPLESGAVKESQPSSELPTKGATVVPDQSQVPQSASTPVQPELQPAAMPETVSEPVSQPLAMHDGEAPSTAAVTTAEEPAAPSAPERTPSESGKTEESASILRSGQMAESFPAREGPEEPEEILQVEPLEEGSPQEDRAVSMVTAPSEGSTESHARVQPVSSEELLERPEGSDWERGPLSPKIPEIGSEPLADSFTAVPAEVPKEEYAAEKADDFTTDTLAELYIAQGFYEKAIDIYERMLVDRPESLALKNKLEKVRAMAAQQEGSPEETREPAEAATEYVDTNIFTQAEQFVPVTETPKKNDEELTLPLADWNAAFDVLKEEKQVPPEISIKDEAITLEDEGRVEPVAPATESKTDLGSGLDSLFTQPEEYKPHTAELEAQPRPVGEMPSTDAFDAEAAQQSAPAKPSYHEFEPQEYVPPDAVPRRMEDESVHAGPAQKKATRKETIDRLEIWLKNIRKEK